MQYDRLMTIATAGSRKSISWVNTTTTWAELVQRLKTPQRTTERLEDFLKLGKREQDALKDIGGFVGGEIKGGRRLSANIVYRDLIALDLDSITTGQTRAVLEAVQALPYASCVYSTRKHADYAPRLRVLMPLDRSVSADEYEPIARRLAERIGIAMADPTTFEPARLMYWPSCSADSDYVYEVVDKPFVCAAEVLATYADWKDISSWPQVPGHAIKQRQHLARQQDPLTKAGIVGAFCKAYTITQAMAAFIPKAYMATADPDRYTYLGGSTTGGAVVYEDKFLYSHHATDPCSGELVNAFDLVRLHLFGESDADAKTDTPSHRLPSYLEMQRLAVSDEAVASILSAERVQKVSEVFDGGENAKQMHSASPAGSLEWVSKLSKHPRTGEVEKTIDNIVTILDHAEGIAGRIALDEFAGRGMVRGALPWNGEETPRLWDEIDDAELARYLELGYGITGDIKINQALTIVSSRNRYNAVADYLSGLKWDGVRRVETVLSEYLGVEDNRYTREVMRTFMTAAVARAMEGGVKFDYTPILSGAQGIGKSTFLAKLGRDWFSDSLQNFEGKEAFEQIQGVWIVEFGELTGFRKSEVTAIKQFLTKRFDIYRKPYGKRTGRFPRRCVFFGTTNEAEFLRDPTGNRRFWPLECGKTTPTKDIFTDLDHEVDQLWAEAVVYWRLGEPLVLSKAADQMAQAQQAAHEIQNEKTGLVVEYLEHRIPENWSSLSLDVRRQYLRGQAVGEGLRLVRRQRVCALEVWAECFGQPKERITRRDSMEINEILSRLDGWTRSETAARFGLEYGLQRGFERKCVMGKAEIIRI